MRISLNLVVVALATVSSAKKCRDLNVTIHAEASNFPLSLESPSSDIEVADFTWNNTVLGEKFISSIYNGKTKTVSGDYHIAATYCEPDDGPGKTLQFLTHGLGFARSYWDPRLENGTYSYVNVAVDDYGYSTFAYDRLGVGMSSHGEAVNEIQQPLEIAAAVQLTKGLRNGTLDKDVPKYETIVHVGHSFGSAITYGLVASEPDLSDGLVLTGWSLDTSGIQTFNNAANFRYAKDFKRFRKYPVGYFAVGDTTGYQLAFFATGDFKKPALDWAAAHGAPIAVGEAISQGLGKVTATKFTKPVQVIVGEHDGPFCSGNCYKGANSTVPSIPAAAKNVFPDVKKFEAVIVPGAGHAINLASNHMFAYDKINKFLGDHGIKGRSG